MKVVYVANKNEKGGAFYSLMEMVLTLREQHGVEPVVLTQGEEKLTEFCRQNGIETYAIGHDPFMLYKGSTLPRKAAKWMLRPYYRIRRKKRLQSALEQAQSCIDFSTVDLIHTNVNRDDIGQELSRKYHIPHVWHIREFSDTDYDCAYLRKQPMEYMNSLNGYFIAISQAVRDAWIKKGLDGEKIRLIYNGLDLAKFGVIKEHDFNKETLHFVFTGAICATKGQEQVIRALSALPEDIRQHICVDFYGSGVSNYILSLKALARSGGVEKQIRFCGYSHALQDVLPQYDGAFVCSEAEAFGRVTVEHMCCGLPVIASDSGANPELIEDGRDGFLYRAGDIHALRDAVVRVYQSRGQLADVSKRAREKALQRFDRRINAENIYHLYEEVTEKYGKKEN